MLAEYFEDEDFSDLWDDEEEEEDDEDLTEEEIQEEEERKELEKFAEFTIDKEWTFEPEPEEPEPEEEEEEPEPENNIPPLWNKFKNQKPKQSKRLRYKIIDFGEEQKKLMSKVDDVFDFTILINNGNPKFQRLYKENSPFLLSLHISEMLIREVSMYRNPLARPSDIDESISDFYENKYSQVKEKSE